MGIEKRLQAQVDELEQALRTQTDECDDATTRFAEEQEKSRRLEGLLDSAHAELEGVKQELARESNEKEQARSQLAASKAEVDEVRLAAKSTARELNRRLEELNDELVQAQDSIKESHEQQEDQAELVARLTDEVNSLNAAHQQDGQKLSQLQDMTQSGQSALMQASERLSGATAKIARLEAQLNQATELLKSERRKANQLERHVAMLEHETAAERKGHVQQLALVQAQLASSSRRLQTIESKAENSLKRLRDENDRMRLKLDDLLAEKREQGELLSSKREECTTLRYSEMEASKAKSTLELELMAVTDKLELARERERAFQDQLAQAKRESSEVVERLNAKLSVERASAQEAIERLQEQLETARKEATSLGQQVENERLAFDQIFKAQAEVLSYSQFPRSDGRRHSQVSPSHRRRHTEVFSQGGTGGDDRPKGPPSPLRLRSRNTAG